jgi:DNA-binding response OmpR family regulator
VMRVRALARRRPHLRATALEIGGIRVDSATHRVTRDGVQLALTSKEFAVLELLMEHAGDAVSRTLLIEHCWDEAADPASNVVDVLIGQLRKRLGSPDPISTIRGVGYRFER